MEDGYPEITADLLKQLGWWDELTEAEKKEAEGKNWKTDLSGGIQRVAIKHGFVPYGNAKARCVVWTFPDQVPKHREPLYTPRRDLLADYATWPDAKSLWRLPTQYASVQEKDVSKEFPIILTSVVWWNTRGRRRDPLQPLAGRAAAGDVRRDEPGGCQRRRRARRSGRVGGGAGRGRVKVKALVTPRVKPGLAFMPFHFGGHFEGQDLRAKYPEGSDPYVLGSRST